MNSDFNISAVYDIQLQMTDKKTSIRVCAEDPVSARQLAESVYPESKIIGLDYMLLCYSKNYIKD